MTEGEVASTKKHTWQSGLKTNGKLGPSGRGPAAQPPKQPQVRGSAARKACTAHAREVAGSNPAPVTSLLTCPECGGKRLYRDGLRYLRDGSTAQRWLCRSCGYRFSDIGRFQSGKAFNNSNISEYVERIDTKILRLQPPTSNRRVCDERNGSRKEHGSPVQMKHHGSGRAGVLQTTEDGNLARVETRQEKAQREGTKPDLETTKGLIAQFMAWLDREGHKSSGYLKRIQRLAILHANLLDPEDVKKVIAEQDWKDSVKCLTVCAYDAFTRMLNIEWTPPRYKPEEALPFIPEKSELEQLIAACRSRRMTAFLQTLMETFADPGEALKLRWIDVDNKNRIITINRPVKRHNPRQLEVSGKLIAMLNSLPHTSKLIFPTSYASMQTCFLQVRKRAARVLLNPRLLEIHFTTFRHWGGSMIAYYTHGNVLTVQKLLGHKSIKNTMKYIHMIHFKDDEFETATATTVKEAEELAAVGFEKFDEFKGIHVYRRPKRFMGYAQH